MSDTPKIKTLHKIAPYVYKFLILLITCTCRVRIHGKEHIDNIQANQGSWIYSIWHNNVLISPWALKNQDVAVMVSESGDGEIISRSVKLFGNTTIRGSTSKGSSKVARQALKVLRQKKPVAITPDGPRGPKYVLQDGVLFLAALAQTPIIPFQAECTRQWEFNSWDNLKLPKPFSTIHFCFGPAIMIDRKQLDEQTELVTDQVQLAMNQIVEQATQLARH